MSLPWKSSLLVLVFLTVDLARADLVPSPKLPSGEPGRFFPQLVRLSDDDSREIESLLNRLNRPDLAKHFRKRKIVPELPRETAVVGGLLTSRSERVREWAVRTLGQTAGDNSAAIPHLLRIVSDPKEEDSTRALAARVTSSGRMAASTVGVFVEQLKSAGKDLRMLLLDLLGKAGPVAMPFLPELTGYMKAPEAAVQFYAFRAVQKIEDSAPAPAADVPKSALAAVSDVTAPKYVLCLGLLNLSTAAPSPESVDAVLQQTGDAEEFVAELAVNVLNAFAEFRPAEIEVLSRGLVHSNSNVRLHSASSLAKCGSQAALALRGLIACLDRAGTQGAPAREVGACLDVLRPLGTNAAAASPVILRLLEERSPIYRDLAKHDVDHLRGFLLATLAEIGVPEQALPVVVGSLANSDGWMTLEFAGAARAAAALGPHAAKAVSLLLRPLQEDLKEQPITFEKFDAHFSSSREYTTCQAEALRALRRIGPPAHAAAPFLREFLQKPLPRLGSPDLYMRLPDLRAEAATTLAAVEPQQ